MRNKKGFTLIELLVVIAIIGLLSTLAVVSLNSARQKARDAARKSDLNSIATAFEMYRTNDSNDQYPATYGVCTAATNIATAASGTLCPGNAISTYLTKIPKDPSSGSGYTYSGSTSTYTITATMEVNTGTTDDQFVCTNGSCVLQ